MKYLPDLLQGKTLGAFGLTEPNAGTDAGGQQTRADLDGDEYVLNGAKVFITNGGYADVFVVMAMTDKAKGNSRRDFRIHRGKRRSGLFDRKNRG